MCAHIWRCLALLLLIWSPLPNLNPYPLVAANKHRPGNVQHTHTHNKMQQQPIRISRRCQEYITANTQSLPEPQTRSCNKKKQQEK